MMILKTRKWVDDDPTLNWAIVYEALGVGEPIIYTQRQASSKRKLPSSGDGIVIVSSQASKKGPAATLSQTKMGKKKI